jgi:hypothetical protein
MNSCQLDLARMEQFQQCWLSALQAAARQQLPPTPRSSEDRLQADARNEAIWLLNALDEYRRIPLEERY